MEVNNKIRIAKFLAEAGVASRRKAEDIISAGKVKIGTEVVKNLATKVSPDADDIFVNGKKITIEHKVYYLLHKPVGTLSSVSDPHYKETVLKFVPRHPRVFPVGRLDKDSSGLLLLSNDGDLTYKVTHPKFEVKKTYLVTINKDIDKKDVAQLKKGVQLTEGIAKADHVVIKEKRKMEIVVHQGWNRQIRRMLGEFGYGVMELQRIKEGKLVLGDLPVGKYKKLDKSSYRLWIRTNSMF